MLRPDEAKLFVNANAPVAYDPLYQRDTRQRNDEERFPTVSAEKRRAVGSPEHPD